MWPISLYLFFFCDFCSWVSPGGDLSSFGLLDCDDFPPLRPENIFDRRPFANNNIVPVFDIKTYEMVYEYAMFALGTQSEKEVILNLYLCDFAFHWTV